MDHLRARATSVDADSMPELGHGLCKPWHWPWSGRRPWTEWKSAFVRRALFSLSSDFAFLAELLSAVSCYNKTPASPRGRASVTGQSSVDTSADDVFLFTRTSSIFFLRHVATRCKKMRRSQSRLPRAVAPRVDVSPLTRCSSGITAASMSDTRTDRFSSVLAWPSIPSWMVSSLSRISWA